MNTQQEYFNYVDERLSALSSTLGFTKVAGDCSSFTIGNLFVPSPSTPPKTETLRAFVLAIISYYNDENDYNSDYFYKFIHTSERDENRIKSSPYYKAFVDKLSGHHSCIPVRGWQGGDLYIHVFEVDKRQENIGEFPKEAKYWTNSSKTKISMEDVYKEHLDNIEACDIYQDEEW